MIYIWLSGTIAVILAALVVYLANKFSAQMPITEEDKAALALSKPANYVSDPASTSPTYWEEPQKG